MTDVAVISTGLANTASVLAAFHRAGVAASLTNEPDTVRRARGVVLPGVGGFGPGMRYLSESGLVQPLRERVQNDKPTLAICLGMQLLCDASEEAPAVAGLGVCNTAVMRFTGVDHAGAPLRVPHLGWNSTSAGPGTLALLGSCVYFANSYRVESTDDTWAVSKANYGGEFVAAMERGRTVACQFHPELSGKNGSRILDRWCNLVRDA